MITITVECDTCGDDEQVEVDFPCWVDREDLLPPGWQENPEDEDEHICAQCLLEQKESRQKGDDDGVEYGDPRDEQDERLER